MYGHDYAQQPETFADRNGSFDDLPRVAVVADWYDASGSDEADVSNEIVGLQVMPNLDVNGGPVPYFPGDFAESVGRTGGFLFCGDDGDSLWFWPESDDVAFRFAPEIARQLRVSLDDGVGRLVSQGALVFCHKVESRSADEIVIEFPAAPSRAA